MVDLLVSEVNEALRQDKLTALWNRWKKPLLMACVALVLGTAISSLANYYKHKAGAKAMEQLSIGADAYRKGDYAAAEKTFAALTENTSGTLNDMSRLWYARSLLQQTKTEQALTQLKALAENLRGDEPLWRDLACLRLEGLSAGDLPKPCETTKGSVVKAQRDTWRAARLYQQGKAPAARSILDEVARDKTASPSERAQAQSLLSVFSTLEEGK